MATDYLDFHVQLQGVANSLGEELAAVLSAEDKKLLAFLQTELVEVRKLMFAKEYSPAFMQRLQKLRTGIETLRDKAVREMTQVIQGTAGRVADLQAKEAGEEIFEEVQRKKEWEAQKAKAKKKEKHLRQKYIRPELTQGEIDNIVSNRFINGYTMEQLMKRFSADDTNRIFQTVQRGIVEGTTLAGIMKAVRENALETSNTSARMVARTVINGVANNTRMEMYRQNADVIDGVKFLATLDSKTCPVCGVKDGKVWATDKLNEVPTLPLHPSCRCVLIPHIDIGEEYEGQRAAEAVNFEKLAEEEYNKTPKEKRPFNKEKKRPYEWNDLKYDYRQELRYRQVRKYEEEHGRGSSYCQVSSGKQVSGSRTFEDYLKGQPPEFQRQYLGVTRAKLFQEGKLTLDQMVYPDKGYFRSVADLEKTLGYKIVPKEWALKKFYETSEAMVSMYSEKERETIYEYSNPDTASAINNMLRRTVAETDEMNQQVDILQEAMKKYVLSEDTIVFRGVADFHWIFPKGIPHVGERKVWDSFTSASVIDRKSADYSKYTDNSVLFEIIVPKGTHGIPMGSHKLSQHLDTDKEFLLNKGIEIEVLGVEKKGHGYYFKVRVVP